MHRTGVIRNTVGREMIKTIYEAMSARQREFVAASHTAAMASADPDAPAPPDEQVQLKPACGFPPQLAHICGAILMANMHTELRSLPLCICQIGSVPEGAISFET